jgi:protein-disulfide isomerase
MENSIDDEALPPETDPIQEEDLEDEAVSSPEEDLKNEAVKKPRRPALVVNVYSWATPIIAVLALVIGLLAGYFGRPLLARDDPSVTSSTTTTSQTTTTDPNDPNEAAQRKEMMSFLVGQVRHFEGDENAPVTIIEFSDFQCPFCGKFEAETFSQIVKNYVETGKVRVGYWHFAFLGQESFDAAEASECASDQNAFWEYHDLLFKSQSGENKGTFAKDKLKQFAANLKLDTQAFNNCLDTGKYTQLVQDLTGTAQSIGVRSTPSFVVNGRAIIGAQPYDVFQQAIELELAGGTQ